MTSIIVGIVNRILHEIPKNERRLSTSVAVLGCLWTQLARFLKEMKSDELSVKSSAEVHSMIYVVTTMLAMVLKQKPELRTGRENYIGRVMAHLFKVINN
jgi:hypothetical protein